jgi:hypothetical protein
MELLSGCFKFTFHDSRDVAEVGIESEKNKILLRRNDSYLLPPPAVGTMFSMPVTASDGRSQTEAEAGLGGDRKHLIQKKSVDGSLTFCDRLSECTGHIPQWAQIYEYLVVCVPDCRTSLKCRYRPESMTLVAILPPTVVYFLAQGHFVEGIATTGSVILKRPVGDRGVERFLG